MTVAETILAQMGGRNRLVAMIGAKNFVGDKDSLQFDIGSGAKNKANKIVIRLMPDDTYKIIAYRYSRKTLECPEVGNKDNIYVENLREHFTSLTGLSLSL